MSYDIYLNDSSGQVIECEIPHHLKGGTYALNGTTQLWLNITHNYSEHFYRVFGNKGIRTLYGMIAEDSIPLILAAMDMLDDDVCYDYWASTEGNAKAALTNLLEMAKLAPTGIWDGD